MINMCDVKSVGNTTIKKKYQRSHAHPLVKKHRLRCLLFDEGMTKIGAEHEQNVMHEVEKSRKDDCSQSDI